MAVKVGNSWVSEAAYAYAQEKASQGRTGGTLDNLSKEFPDLNFTANTKPFSGSGTNNIAVAPNILKQMESDPDKQLEYEALLYDCSEAVKKMPAKTANGSTIKSFGFIINADGSLGAWSVSESGKGTEKNRYSLDKEKKGDWMDEMFGTKKKEELDTYEKSDSSDKAAYSINKMSAENRAQLVKKLQADQEARQQQLVDIVRKTISKQAGAYGKADTWKFLSGGAYTVDPAVKSQAQKDISEDGYYGVKQTSQRLFDFASALAGDDVEQMKKMQKAMEKGFRQAGGAWGKKLPGICHETFAAANKLFEEYYASKRTAQEGETV